MLLNLLNLLLNLLKLLTMKIVWLNIKYNYLIQELIQPMNALLSHFFNRIPNSKKGDFCSYWSTKVLLSSIQMKIKNCP